MEQQNDILLSRLAVKLINADTMATCGTGIIYNSKNLKDHLYIITAAHCLYHDGDKFEMPFEKIYIDFYNDSSKSYERITHTINYNSVSPNKEEDVAVFVMDKVSIETVVGKFPFVEAVQERQAITTFTLKGFPNATSGEELDSINPIWSQAMTVVNKFQLKLTDDYTDWSINGFSGSGVFLHTDNKVYLYGIFTRYRREGQGRVIYCQYLQSVNKLLESNFLPTIIFTFLSEHGFTPIHFKQQIERAIKNLGPRFNQKINFRLPIVEVFHELSKDLRFKARFLGNLDKFILTNGFFTIGNNSVAKDTKQQHEDLKQWIISWIPTLNWSPDRVIDISPLLRKFEDFERNLDNKLNEVYQLQSDKIKEEAGKGKESSSYDRPYSSEISELREMSANCSKFLQNLSRINFELVNNPCLFIKGEAGCGKSHLLGDIATKWQEDQKPVILLLGQLFKKERALWDNIITQIGLQITKTELLESLNSIGKQLGFRIPILIDALNEGGGTEIWHDELSGFIDEFKNYPFVALVLTVRTTYWDEIVPTEVQDDKAISKWTHEGFKGNEYAALSLFCQYYSLQQPNFPILAPEFTNPLFLHLVCQGTKDAGEQSFPKGFQGFTIIFSYYLKAIGIKLEKKRSEYKLRSDLAEQAIQLVAEEIFKQKNYRYLTLVKANELFDHSFAKFQFLLADLIEENIFIKNIFTDYEADKKQEGIFFAYERIGDYYIADKLLKEYSSRDEVKVACEKNNRIGQLTADRSWKNQGIIEALAVILPERYNLEIFEAYDWIFLLKNDQHRYIEGNLLNYFLLGSLKWRKPQSVDKEKILKWFREKHFRIDDDQILFYLTELTTYITNPFNSDFIHSILIKLPLGKRDAFWLQYLLSYTGVDDDGNARPINRLIDWAWQENLSASVDPETARLAGQMLAWVLSTTHRPLRDQTTKAMVNLLQEQSDALVNILNTFRNVDDPYITERLYAIALGCALRTTQITSLKKIAQYTYDTIFKEGKPPVHILLRDYARNIVEYAIYKNIGAEFNGELIRPPYGSTMPEHLPSDKEIKKYKRNYESKTYKNKKYSGQFNQIHFSVMDWDFGRYTIESALRNFSIINFSLDEKIGDFVKALPRKSRSFIKLFEEQKKLEATVLKHKNRPTLNDQQKEFIAQLEEYTKYLEKIIEEFLNKEQFLYFKTIILVHIDSKVLQESGEHINYPSIPIKRWIVKRAHELGYDEKIHGQYDSSVGTYERYTDTRVERIGKKYQWIAFHEVMARITDNFKMREDWVNRSKYNFYEGPWQMYIRDIDPVFITRDSSEENDKDNNDELGILEIPNVWWMDITYSHWEQDDFSWSKNTNDLPNPLKVLQCIDPEGEEWVYLNLHVTWEQPKALGKDKYNSKRKEIWYMFQAYLVAKKDKTKIKKWLSEQNFRGRWLPESYSPTQLINREHYWSPISQKYKKETSKGAVLNGTSHKVIIATNQAVGEMSDDKSGAHFYYDIPCKQIFESLGLQYAGKDGYLTNQDGELIVSNINPRGTLIRKKSLMEFLKKNDMDIVWTILGEKRVLKADFSRHGNYFGTISGVYTIEDRLIKGSFNLSEDN